MYVVDGITEQIVWGPYPSDSQKGFRYECDYPGIIALKIGCQILLHALFHQMIILLMKKINLLFIQIHRYDINRFSII